MQRTLESLAVVLIALLATVTACARPPASSSNRAVAVAAAATPTQPTRPATTQTSARPDPELWSRRNIDVLRKLGRRVGNENRDREFNNGLSFSLQYNYGLWRDPHAGELATLLERVRKKRIADRELRESLDRSIAFLREPAERRAYAPVRERLRRADFAIEPAKVHDVVREMLNSPRDASYEGDAKMLVERIDQACRDTRQWARLADAYRLLAFDALRLGNVDRAAPHLDRMAAILRDHQETLAPVDQTSPWVNPLEVATVLAKAARSDDLAALLRRADGPVREQLAYGAAQAYLNEGELREARHFALTWLAPTSPEETIWVIALIDGVVAAPPAAATRPATAPATRSVRGPDVHARSLARYVYRAHARRGDVDLAARQMIAAQSPSGVNPAGLGNLDAHEWAQLGSLAHAGGHDDASRQAFERALEVLPGSSVDEPHEIAERTDFVREAVRLGEFDLAYRLLAFTSAPGAWTRQRLARAQRQRGNAARADVLIDEAIAIAGKDRGEGNVMATVAADVHEMGEVARAEQLFARAVYHIDGVDFGYRGVGSIVSAAMRMNRLDLLDRLYASLDKPEHPDAPLLLCIVAARVGSGSKLPGEDE